MTGDGFSTHHASETTLDHSSYSSRAQSRNNSFNDDFDNLSSPGLHTNDRFDSPTSSHHNDPSRHANNSYDFQNTNNERVDVPSPGILIDVLVKSMSLQAEQASDLHEIANVFFLIY